MREWQGQTQPGHPHQLDSLPEPERPLAGAFPRSLEVLLGSSLRRDLGMKCLFTVFGGECLTDSRQEDEAWLVRHIQ